jgi:hypothetical protein
VARREGGRQQRSLNPQRSTLNQLVAVLAAMNGQPKAEQKKMYQQMRLNNRLMFK